MGLALGRILPMEVVETPFKLAESKEKEKKTHWLF